MADSREERRRKAREALRRRIRAALDRADEAFRGQYADELTDLLGLSREEIDAITPGTTDLETYDRLIEVVKEASRLNASQAALAENIRGLGALAVSIAGKVPRLAAMLYA